MVSYVCMCGEKLPIAGKTFYNAYTWARQLGMKLNNVWQENSLSFLLSFCTDLVVKYRMTNSQVAKISEIWYDFLLRQDAAHHQIILLTWKCHDRSSAAPGYLWPFNSGGDSALPQPMNGANSSQVPPADSSQRQLPYLPARGQPQGYAVRRLLQQDLGDAKEGEQIKLSLNSLAWGRKWLDVRIWIHPCSKNKRTCWKLGLVAMDGHAWPKLIASELAGEDRDRRKTPVLSRLKISFFALHKCGLTGFSPRLENFAANSNAISFKSTLWT